MIQKTRLSVNINKIPVFRNVSGCNLPNLLQVAPKIVTIEFNIEGNPDAW